MNRLQALIDKFRPELDTIQANLTAAQDNIDALHADVLDAKALADKAQDTANNSYGVGADRKFQISGYIQGRYQDVSSGQGTLSRYPQGSAGGNGAYNGNYQSGTSPSTFDVHRARIKFTGQVTGNTRYGVQIDTSGAITSGASANQQVTVREAYAAYTTGNGDVAKNLTVTAGLFNVPFGYNLPASRSTLISPERPLAFNEGTGGPFLLAEYVGGLYEQRSYFNSDSANGLTTAYAKDNHVDGYYATVGWTFGQTGNHPLTLAGQYDVLRRGEGPTNTFNSGGSDAYTDENVGYGALYNLDKATRLRFWFERADKVAHLPGTAEPPRYGLFTGEIQVKF